KYIMGWEIMKKKTKKQQRLFIKLSPEEETIVNILKEKQELGIDKISSLSKLSASKVASALLNLEFEGIIKCLPGKVYRML
ncbi:MAG: DNA-protecting protein DprA, partial [Bacteroidales bacterium]|nr:DNA-protecting protein DprA [Bacteroidales bacterium]